MGGKYLPYFRVDYTDRGSYNVSEYPLGTYDPDVNHVPSIPLLNVRVGVDVGPIDVNLYALNATDSTAGPRTGGRSGCENAACTLYTTYAPLISVTPANMPLTVGLQFTYTH
jgi:hypothetical protein